MGGRVSRDMEDASTCVVEEEEEEVRQAATGDSPPTGRTLSPAKARELDEFRRQLSKKRDERRRLIAEKSGEMRRLREQLDEERRLRMVGEPKQVEDVVQLQSSLDQLQAKVRTTTEQNRQLKCDVAECHAALETANSELALLNGENVELKKHVRSLKDVNKVSKEMLAIRETQLQQLKEKLTEIEASLADRELHTLSNDLRSEYERQLENIRSLRSLYEERARMAEVTRQNLVRDLEQQKSLTEFQTNKCTELEYQVKELEKEIVDKNEMLGNKESQLGLSKAEARNLQAEMTVINQLFSQMLLGYNNTQDLDKLVLRLEANHDLLTDMVVREDCSEVSSALPKLILDLLNQVDASEEVEISLDKTDLDCDGISAEASVSKTLTSAEEIVGNLPKVWRVLMELLSHQAGPQVVLPTDITDKTTNSCYKSIETPSGPRLVPSVSKTYIRLKDLILEKKALQKEMNHLKQLNGHLENRLQDQERRLGLVSSELNKTWHVVGRMQRQHQQLHAHEQILRFELQQKRFLLTELKEQLEFCKEKWDMAKLKNSQSQEEWNKLRIEFTSRKVNQQIADSVLSAESGYSDEKSDDDSDKSDSEKITERKRIKKRNKNNSEGGVKVAENIPQSPKSPDSNDEEETNEPTTSTADELEDSSRATNYDDMLAARSARLKKLEEQCYVLVHKVTKTNSKGIQLCNRLEKLHNQYGGSEEGQGGSGGSSDPPNDQNEKCTVDSEKEDRVSIVDDSADKRNDSSINENASTSASKFDYEARFAARDERLKRMEDQARSLVDKVTNTNSRGEDIANKLTDLHNTHSRDETTEACLTTQSNLDSDNIKDNNIENPRGDEEDDSPDSRLVAEVELSTSVSQFDLEITEQPVNNLVNPLTNQTSQSGNHINQNLPGETETTDRELNSVISTNLTNDTGEENLE